MHLSRKVAFLFEPRVLRWIVPMVVVTSVYLFVGDTQFRVPLILFDSMMGLYTANELFEGK